jgi:hypothetical protein
MAKFADHGDEIVVWVNADDLSDLKRRIDVRAYPSGTKGREIPPAASRS